MGRTILLCTDNTLDREIAEVCRTWLVKMAEDIPIVSVSHEPIDVGTNICIGKRSRSWLTLYRQLHVGLEMIKTRWVVIAEHDCIYSKEHLNWTPPTDDTFFYNDNMWLLQWKSTRPELDGMFSYWPKRYALSQLVCNRDIFLDAVTKRLDVIDKERWVARAIKYAGEPGTTRIDEQKAQERLKKVQERADSGSSAYLHKLLQDFAGNIELEKAKKFKTKAPNIDIRHSRNFTGPKRGVRRCYELPPWGTLKDLTEVA